MSDCHTKLGSRSKKQSLPYDVLQLVFSDVRDVISNLGEKEWAIQRAHLYETCHIWQEALVSVPSLWCQLYIPVDASYETVGRLIEEASSRSGTRLMSWWFGRALRDPQTRMNHDESVLCSQGFDPIASRCRRLTIDNDLTLYSVATLMPTAHLSAIKSLVMSRISKTEDPVSINRETQPRLWVDHVQELRVYLPSMALDLLPPTVSLTSMRATISSSGDPRTLLELGAHSLTDLFIEYPEDLQTKQACFLSGPLIIMHRLTKFTVEVPPDFELGRWLRHMYFPCVRVLVIGFKDRSSARFSMPGTCDLAPVLDMNGVNRFPHLRAVTLGAQAMPDGFVLFMCGHHHLRNLVFVDIAAQAVRSAVAALNIAQVLPRLRLVHFHNCHISEDDQDIVQLRDIRCAARPDAAPFQIKCTSSGSRQG
jgi:hypothetical protein